MPTKRTRSSRGSRLNLADYSALSVGCGANNYSDAERERLRGLWLLHGRRLIAEAEAAGNIEPWALSDFGRPEDIER